MNAKCLDSPTAFVPIAGLLRTVVFVFLVVGLSPFSYTQGEAVHIAPQVQPMSPDHSENVALTTHTKPFKADVNLVLVPVIVTDPEDRAVTGLQKANFAVYENQQKQAIQSFSSEDAPVSVGIIFDMSGSMVDKMAKSKEAVAEFLRRSNPEDEFFVIGFSDKPALIVDFTKSLREIVSKLSVAAGKGKTALLDAIYLGMQEMQGASLPRKALLIISDGGDNHSRYTAKELRRMVKEADVQVYAMGIFDSKPKTPEEIHGPGLLADISAVTGGRLFTIEDPNELPDVAIKIGEELRTEYVIGYRPLHSPQDGKWRKVKVKLIPPKGLPRLTWSAKEGYYASSE